MAPDPRGIVKKIHYKVGGTFDVFLEKQTRSFVTDDLVVQQTIAAALAVREEVILPLKDGKIERVERANPIPPQSGGIPKEPLPPYGKITGIGTQVDGATGKSFFEVFFEINSNVTQYRSSDPAIQTLCLTASQARSFVALTANNNNEIIEATLAPPIP